MPPVKKSRGNSYNIRSENPMFWRGSYAALKAGCLIEWPNLPQWHKAWIVAVVETDIIVSNVMSMVDD